MSIGNGKRLNIKACIITFFIVLAIILGISYIKKITSTVYKLEKIGYTEEESNKIIELNYRLNEILKSTYNKNIVGILSEKYYIDKYYNDYLEYIKEHDDKSYSDVIAIVNVGANKEFYTNIVDADLNKGNSILVNKYSKLKDDYEPENLVDISYYHCFGKWKINEEVYTAFKQMFNTAKDKGYTLIINQAYRSYEDQEEAYNASNDNYAARPGSSEHQTGLALDIITYKDDSYDAVSGSEFKDTDTYKWLINNSYKYGFILRYPEGKEYLTGYKYESWHFRYLGIDLATKVYNSGLTYDEYYAYYIANEKAE